jgi:hypothetical protein
MDCYKIEVEAYVNLVDYHDNRFDLLVQTYQDLQDHMQRLGYLSQTITTSHSISSFFENKWKTNFDGNIHWITRIKRASELNSCPSIFFTTLKTMPIAGCVINDWSCKRICISILSIDKQTTLHTQKEMSVLYTWKWSWPDRSIHPSPISAPVIPPAIEMKEMKRSR